MKFNIKKVIKITYFIILQISFGCMYWLLYPFFFYFKSLLCKFIISMIFISGIAFPNFYISERLIINAKLCRFLQIGISSIVAAILFFKMGKVSIILQ